MKPAEKAEENIYDILFDEPFQGGLTRAGPRSAQRCYGMHWAAFINLSHGERIGNCTSIRVVGNNNTAEVK